MPIVSEDLNHPDSSSTHLPSISIPTPITLRVNNTPRAPTLKLMESFDLRDIRNTVVPIRYNHSIKILLPPIIAPATRLPQHNLPLAFDFAHKLDSRIVRYEILVPLAIDETLNISLDRLPGSEWCVYSVSSD
jgi:hypothetical protein